MKAGVVVFPGSNCETDTYDALNYLGFLTEYIWHRDTDLRGADLVVLPGGFSYGDYLRCGAVARFSEIMEEITAFANSGGLVMGICNGFQILLEAGLLPGAMLHNKDLKFICQTVNLRVDNNELPFTSQCEAGEILSIPINHYEGNYFIDEKGLEELEENSQIALRYVDVDGENTPGAAPNGATANIAGITNKKGNVFGLMPHPERVAEEILGSADGAKIFLSAKNKEVAR